MFIVYSKQTGDIKNIATGDTYKEIKDLFPYDYKDYEIIYDTLSIPDDLFVINNFNMFRVQDGKLALKQSQLEKYK